MQKGFMFLLIIWNASPFASGNKTNHLPLSLGCQAVIPCQRYRGHSNSFKWFYKKDTHSKRIQIFFQDKAGLKRYYNQLRPRMKALGNRSLVIDNLTEDDQGLYWCENCFEDNCLENPTTVLSVKKEILKETNMTFYVTAGNNFTHVCPGEFTNLKWTFEASNMTALRDSVQGPQRQFVTSNKSIHIVNIKKADAGKYTCWTSGCNGHRWKILTINLCVVTVNHSEDSSVSCAVMCDMEFNNIKPASTSNVTDTRTVLRDPYGFLNCSTRQMFDGCSTVKSTHLCKTTGTPTEQEHLIRIRGISAALACLLLMAFCLICFLSPRWLKAFPTHLCCCGLKGRVEEEASVVYLSVVIRRPAETTDNHMTCNDCVYSEVVHK